MSNFYKFPHIEQLRNVLVNLKHKYQNPIQTNEGWKFDESLPLPTLDFIGTIKLDGTNAAIVYNPNGLIDSYQSRERVITPNDDNMGFAKFAEHTHLQHNFTEKMRKEASINNAHIIVYGEFCGKGIQSRTAISELPKMFVIFAVKIGSHWLEPFEFEHLEYLEENIFNIYRYQTYKIKIDFNNLEKSVTGLEKYVEEVETCCPVGITFGQKGIGEGIVWRCNIGDEEGPWMFKTKGEKHKNIKESKVIQLNPEKANNIAELISKIVTEHRLTQGIQKLQEKGLDLSKKNTGEFIKWVAEDVFRENKDILDASGLDTKEVNQAVQKSAREWFFKQSGI